MRTLTLTLALLAVPFSPAWAQSMTVATFLAKAEALQKKGKMAIFSKDLRIVMREGKAAGAALRADRLADVKAGRPPAFCPPKKAELDSNEVLGHFRAIPPAQRGMTVKAALGGLMRKKFPCRG